MDSQSTFLKTVVTVWVTLTILVFIAFYQELKDLRTSVRGELYTAGMLIGQNHNDIKAVAEVVNKHTRRERM